MAIHSLLQGHVHFAMSLLVGFYALLRTGGIVALYSTQCHVDAHGNFVLSLGQCKAGKRRRENEYAVIEAGPAATLLGLFIRRAPFAFCQGPEWQWRRRFDQTLSELGLPQLGLRPYSLRRGGATLAFRRRVPLSKVCVRGRWSGQISRLQLLDSGFNLE